MKKNKKKQGLFLFADYYDATTASRRVLNSTKHIFENLKFAYWARLGVERQSREEIYDNIEFESFNGTARPRSLQVLMLFIKFQIWLIKILLKEKSDFVVAFTFYTIFPSLFYKYFVNWKCKVIYDPRDYVSVSFRINPLIAYLIRLLDNICMKLSDFVIFPDRQYFIHYGMFKLKQDKYLIIPNSAEDMYEKVVLNDIFAKYSLPRDKYIIPVLGYFSETRGEKILFELIERNHKELFFVFAGDMRDPKHLKFFEEHAHNLIFLDKVPYIDALSIMQNSILVPQLYDPSTVNNVYAMPTKYYDCLMIGTPVVVSHGQIDVAEEINKNNFGWSIDYNDTDALEKLIFELINNENLIKKGNLRNYFLKNYDYSIFKEKLKNVYLRFI